MQFADPYVNRAYDGPVWLGPDTVEGSLGQMKKALSEIMVHGAAMWWFDMWGGWYNHEQYMDFMHKAGKIYEHAVLSDDIKTQASVAVFVDEDALNHVSYGANHLSSALTQSQMVKLGATGAMHHSYMLTDLPEVNPDDYRVLILMFPCRMNNDIRAALEKWRAKGRTVLQVFMPDYYGFGIENATGFSVTENDEIVNVNAVYGNEKFMGRDIRMPDIRINPEIGDIVLAKTTDGNPAVVMRRNDEYQEILSLVPNMPTNLLRDIILISGGHVFTFGGDPITANSRYVTIHAASDGVKRIHIPRKGQLKDAFTGEILPGNETHTDMKMKFGETRVFEILYKK